MAGYVDPPAGGVASDNVSPVTASQDPTTKLLMVGPRSSGLPTGTNQLDSLITTMYDLNAYAFLRRNLLFDKWATTKPTNESHRGAVVQFNFVDDLDDTVATATLEEAYDVLPTPLHSYKTTLSLVEYGRVVTDTALFRATNMIGFDPVKGERVNRNSRATMDRLAYSVITTAGGITNAGAANGSVPTDVTVAGQPSRSLRAVYQSFLDNNVEPFDDGWFYGAITPAALTALKNEADAAGFRYYDINQDPNGGGNQIARLGGRQGIYYEGFRLEVSTGVGSGVGGVFGGKEGLAKGFTSEYGDMPRVVIGPVVDRLQRFRSLGWYWIGGYARFRAEAIVTANPAG